MDLIPRFVLFAPVMLLSMVAHEYAHAYAALKQGDTTAQSLGRVTWNPLKHIDPFFTVVMPLMTFVMSSGSFLFGGAKPVPVDPRNYRHYVRGDIIVSLAGIATNLVLVVVFVAVIAMIGLVGRALPGIGSWLFLLQAMCAYGVFVNLLLAVFNLFPLPPLDGSHVVKHLLPRAWSAGYQRLARFGMMILLALLVFDNPILRTWMSPVWKVNGFAADALRPLLVDGPWPNWFRSWTP